MAARNIPPELRKRPYKARPIYARSNEYLLGPRPNNWRSGPDQVKHQQYIAWGRHRSQAAYRGESHELTFEEWCRLWDKNDHWFNRGRLMTSSILTRRDSQGAWSYKNCEIIARAQLHQRVSQKRTGMTYKKRGSDAKKS